MLCVIVMSGFQLFIPRPAFCTDNGIMIAWLGQYYYSKRQYLHSSSSIPVDRTTILPIIDRRPVGNVVDVAQMLSVKKTSSSKHVHKSTPTCPITNKYPLPVVHSRSYHTCSHSSIHCSLTGIAFPQLSPAELKMQEWLKKREVDARKQQFQRDIIEPIWSDHPREAWHRLTMQRAAQLIHTRKQRLLAQQSTTDNQSHVATSHALNATPSSASASSSTCTFSRVSPASSLNSDTATCRTSLVAPLIAPANLSHVTRWEMKYFIEQTLLKFAKWRADERAQQQLQHQLRRNREIIQDIRQELQQHTNAQHIVMSKTELTYRLKKKMQEEIRKKLEQKKLNVSTTSTVPLTTDDDDDSVELMSEEELEQVQPDKADVDALWDERYQLPAVEWREY